MSKSKLPDIIGSPVGAHRRLNNSQDANPNLNFNNVHIDKDFRSFSTPRFIESIIAEDKSLLSFNNLGGRFQVANDKQFQRIKDLCDIRYPSQLIHRYGTSIPRSLKYRPTPSMYSSPRLQAGSPLSRLESESYHGT